MDPKPESKKSQYTPQKLGGEACTVNLYDPTTIADTTIAYIRDGNMGNAITAMTSDGPAPVNDDTVSQVKDLLIPTKPKPVWTDTRAEFGPRAAQLEEERVSGLIRTTPKRSGADVYGWTYEHLQTLIGDKEAIKTLSGTLNHILGNRISSETARDLNTARVTPLLKGSKGKIRPLTVGATLKDLRCQR